MSETKPTITTEQLAYQVAEYTRMQPDYKAYAGALKRVLEQACRTAFPEAFVQAREKSVTSFAEKCVRRFETYPDAVNQMTDLCGGRVIVQTLGQVKAVRRYIEANFTVEESDEKGLRLGTDKFGYRDMHYIVRLPMKPSSGGCAPGAKSASAGTAAIDRKRAAALGFTAAEIKAIGDKRAEIQVRTWVQHAWADTLHDRMYKTSLKSPAGFKREGNLLAAIMEEGDRAFDRLAGEIDGMLANFNAYASEADVRRELEVQELILANAEEKKKPEIALRIARLLAPRGDFAGVVDRLAAHADTLPPLGCVIRTELGHALCQLHRAAPRSAPYIEGQDRLREVVAHCRRQTFDSVPDLRRRTGTQARALARLAWSYEAIEEDAHLARDCYREALQLEPDNPYYLADVIGHEIGWSKRRDFVGAMAAGVRQAIGTCLQHVRNGTEMPYAAFTAGRLHLLLDEAHKALGCYARGIRHVLSGDACVPPGVFEAEEKWLILVTKPEPLSGGCLWAMELLRLAGRLRDGAGRAEGEARQGLKTPVLIVGGGAASLKPGQVDRLRPMLAEAFAGFEGTVFSGGTRVGVPGCVGAAADLVGPRGKRPFTLLGYLPRVRPDDAPEDERYDRLVKCAEQGFSAEQILRNWADILDAGIRPEEVRLLGFGGGELSAAEYCIALGLGACVGLVAGSGGAAAGLIEDDLWAGSGNLLPIPCDPASARALAHPPRARREFDDAKIEQMGIAFHEEYVRNSTSRLPDNMKPWKKLKDTFKTASIEQARYSVQILEACGFKVGSAPNPDKDAVTFTDEEVKRMAELEHGRWNVERLREGWRYAEVRDDAKKLHNCLLPWTDHRLDDVRHYDEDSVRKFPEILAQAGLEIVARER